MDCSIKLYIRMRSHRLFRLAVCCKCSKGLEVDSTALQQDCKNQVLLSLDPVKIKRYNLTTNSHKNDKIHILYYACGGSVSVTNLHLVFIKSFHRYKNPLFWMWSSHDSVGGRIPLSFIASKISLSTMSIWHSWSWTDKTINNNAVS